MDVPLLTALAAVPPSLATIVRSICWLRNKRDQLAFLDQFDRRHPDRPDDTVAVARAIGADQAAAPPTVSAAVGAVVAHEKGARRVRSK